jgi:hypothetical protein
MLPATATAEKDLMNIRSAFLLTFALSLIGVLGVASSASALGPAFTCDAVTYQVVGNQLKIGAVESSTSPATLTYTNVGGRADENYNAAGYNTTDNFIYGISSGHELVQVAADGSIEFLGEVQGLTEGLYAAGDMMPDGENLMVFNSTDKSFWRVNLDLVQGFVVGETTSDLDMGDFAIVQEDSTITAYGFDTVTGGIISFDPTAGVVTASLNASISVEPGSLKGSVWADSAGNLTVFANSTGAVYSIANPSGTLLTATLVAAGTPLLGNDGMKCALAASAFIVPEGPTASPVEPAAPSLAVTGATSDVISGLLIFGCALILVGVGAFGLRGKKVSE